MGRPVAREGDRIVGMDVHIVQMPSPAGPVPTPLPSPFAGPLSRNLAGSVYAGDRKVAVLGSEADNTPAHIPSGGPFQRSPSNVGKVSSASSTVFAGGKGVARMGDSATCCNDPSDADTGSIIVSGGEVYAE